MRTYIGSLYKVRKSDGSGGWVHDTHYFQTHADAVEDTISKTFLTANQKTLLLAAKNNLDDAIGELSTIKNSAYATLINRINALYAAYASDDEYDTIINKLQELVAFISSANIAEGEDVTLESFIKSVSASLEAVSTNIVPEVDNSISIGASNLRFKNLFLSGDLLAGTIKIGSFINIRDASDNKFEEMKSLAVKTTTPAATDYTRSALKEGLLWVDTDSVPDSAAYEARPSIYVTYCKKRLPWQRVATTWATAWIKNNYFMSTGETKSIIPALSYGGAYGGVIPVVEFDTAWGRMAICLSTVVTDSTATGETYNIVFYVAPMVDTGYPVFYVAKDYDHFAFLASFAISIMTSWTAFSEVGPVYSVPLLDIPYSDIELPEAIIIQSNPNLVVPGVNFLMNVDWS